MMTTSACCHLLSDSCEGQQQACETGCVLQLLSWTCQAMSLNTVVIKVPVELKVFNIQHADMHNHVFSKCFISFKNFYSHAVAIL